MAHPNSRKLPPKPASKDVDWAAIRKEWETQDVSEQQLALRWGFKSENSIRRTRINQGWVRDIEALAARLVTQSVAYAEGAGIKSDIADEIRSVRTNPHMARTSAQPPHTQDGITQDGADKPLGSKQSRQRDQDDERDLGTAKHLATIHARAIREQIAVGDTAIQVAVIFLDRVAALGTSTDETVIADSRARLLSLNAEKDTMAGIIKALGGLLETGVKIKRAALGMDMVKTANTPSQVAHGTAAAQVIRDLDLPTLLKMRGAAQEIARLPPTIEHEVTP